MKTECTSSGSVPCYVPARLNDGKSGFVDMRPLTQLTDSHAVFGGPLTHRLNRNGIRVRNQNVRYGTVLNGSVSCDKHGRINARRLNNDSCRAAAAARKLYHEVYGRSAKFTTSTLTNALYIVNTVSAVLRWIADTGASMDFIGKGKLSTLDKSRLVKVHAPNVAVQEMEPLLLTNKYVLNGATVYPPKHGLCLVTLRHALVLVRNVTKKVGDTTGFRIVNQ